MAASDDRRDEQFWSAWNFGALLIAAALVSVVRHGITGEWPAGFDGWAAIVFAAVGLALIGHSLAHRTAGRQSVNQ
ncbi:hypothetical protein [Halosimplex sp. J119]